MADGSSSGGRRGPDGRSDRDGRPPRIIHGDVASAFEPLRAAGLWPPN